MKAQIIENVKEGSIRSLGINAVKLFDGDTEKAKKLTQTIKEKYGNDFTIKDIQKEYKKMVKPVEKKTNKKESDPRFVITDYRKETAEDEDLSKNEKMRRLLNDGASPTLIAKLVGVSYQRVINVRKASQKLKKD